MQLHQDIIALTQEQVAAAVQTAAGREIKRVCFVACGGSLATISPGKYILEQLASKVDCHIYNAGEFVACPPRLLDAGTLVVLNSQTGGTAETVAAAKLAAGKGALTFGFTTAPGSPIEDAVDCTVYYYDNPLNPYPQRLAVFPAVYQLLFALVDLWEGEGYSTELAQALDVMQDVYEANSALFRARAKEFARAAANEPLVYTVAGGLNYPIAYVITNCLIMESIWRHSSPLHAGEFFHGAFEAVDGTTMVLALLGIGPERQLEERAVKFLQRKTEKLFVIDAAAFDLDAYPERLRPWLAPLVANKIGADYIDQLSYLLGHPVSSRRYMGVEKY